MVIFHSNVKLPKGKWQNWEDLWWSKTWGLFLVLVPAGIWLHHNFYLSHLKFVICIPLFPYHSQFSWAFRDMFLGLLLPSSNCVRGNIPWKSWQFRVNPYVWLPRTAEQRPHLQLELGSFLEILAAPKRTFEISPYSSWHKSWILEFQQLVLIIYVLNYLHIPD